MATEYFPLGGGLDQVTPSLAIQPGRASVALNYEADIAGGYRRVAGYERFDGRAAPSAAGFFGLRVVGAFVNAADGFWQVGQTIVGGTSGATALVASVEYIRHELGGYNELTQSIPYSTGQYPAPFTVVLSYWVFSGEFIRGETITTGAISGDADSAPQSNYAVSLDAYFSVLYAAQDARRALIAEVPGIGPVRGVFKFNEQTYALRDFDESTKRIYRATSSGWEQFDLGIKLGFKNGTTELFAGDVLQDPSNRESTILGVVTRSGVWADDNARGYVIATPGVIVSDGEQLRVDGINVALSDGPQASQTIAAGGIIRAVQYNFFGHQAFTKIYGVDGVNPAFQFDGVGYVPIETGMAIDTPTFVAAHQKYLWLAFQGGSLQHSSLGNPLEWNPVTGAGEIGIGEEIAEILPTTETLAVFSRNQTYMLYGSVEENFELRLISPDTGAFPGTVQNFGKLLFLDDRGVSTLEATQAFGNFAGATLSEDVRPYLREVAGNARCSLVLRERGTYRIFFSNGNCLCLTVKAGQPVGFMPQVFPFVANVAWSGENADGSETALIGADNGFVYQLERGPSFDGADIQHALRLAFANFRSPRQRKRFRLSVFDLLAAFNTRLRVQPTFDYGSPDTPPADIVDIDVVGGGLIWNNGNWGNFVWSAQAVSEARVRTDGTASNIGLLIFGSQKSEPHVLQGCTISFEPRRVTR